MQREDAGKQTRKINENLMHIVSNKKFVFFCFFAQNREVNVPPSDQVCRYLADDPFLRLAPFKVEVLSPEPSPGENIDLK